MKAKSLPLFALIALLALGACQSTTPPSSDIPADPDDAICELRAAWQSAPGCQLYSGAPCADGRETRSRAMIRRQAENLAFRHPNHIDTRMFCGILAYEAENPVAAVRHLDHVLRIRPDTPEAVVLRARIALEDGNEMYAVRVLEDQLTLRPDSYAVRETLAAAYFMTENHDAARLAIDASERLGAPNWRVAYNRGLLAELDGDLTTAYTQYHEAIAYSPAWPMPRERLAGLTTIEGFEAPAATAAVPPPAPVVAFTPEVAPSPVVVAPPPAAPAVAAAVAPAVAAAARAPLLPAPPIPAPPAAPAPPAGFPPPNVR